MVSNRIPRRQSSKASSWLRLSAPSARGSCGQELIPSVLKRRAAFLEVRAKRQLHDYLVLDALSYDMEFRERLQPM